MQVRGLGSPNMGYSNSIVKNYLQFVPFCRSLFQFVRMITSLKIVTQIFI